ncbi:hypothetical protein KIN20_015485 [Parelaphostrongylus tenuis]|uniref:Uncharacterized protein n=1 Tax=Parelaphostrongylus tenuis TaxID=148309 RepID=A0AAD5MYI8_PARTN|nr:hypothetical protein KIN20_015485 [Parelaphostrongylus tenuis]
MRKVRIRFEKKWGIYHQMFERSYKRCNRSKADPWRRYGALRKLHEIGGTGRTLPNQDNSRVPQNFYQIEAGSIPPPPPRALWPNDWVARQCARGSELIPNPLRQSTTNALCNVTARPSLRSQDVLNQYSTMFKKKTKKRTE